MLLKNLTKWAEENDIGDLPGSAVGESGTLTEVPVAKDSVLVIFEAGPDDWPYSNWYTQLDSKTGEFIERPWEIDIMTDWSVIFSRNPNYFRKLKKGYQDVIRELYMKHNHNPDETLDSLFAKWEGKEKDLYTTICEKYGVEPNVAYTKTGIPLRLYEVPEVPEVKVKQKIEQEVDRVEPEPAAKAKKASKKMVKTTTKKVAKTTTKKVETKNTGKEATKDKKRAPMKRCDVCNSQIASARKKCDCGNVFKF